MPLSCACWGREIRARTTARRRTIRSFSDLHYNFKQSALFGEATYRFTHEWAVTGGIRWFKFTEDKSVYFAGLFSNHPPRRTPVFGSTDSNGVAPRLILTYDATQDVKINLQASRGFRLGGINDPLNVPICGAADFATYGGLPVKWKDEWAWRLRARATKSSSSTVASR